MKITNTTINKKLDKILEILENKQKLGVVSEFPYEAKFEEDKFITIKDNGVWKTSEIIAEMKELFSVWSFYSDEELDKMFPPVKTENRYKYVQEADEDLKHMSAEDLEEKGIKCITLRERLLFELAYFKREGKHLDEKNVTLCAGSRYSGGFVPHVDCYDSKVFVSWNSPDSRDDALRPRRSF